MRFAVLDVAAARHGIDQIADAGTVEIVVEFVLPAIGAQSDPDGGRLEIFEQCARARERVGSRQVVRAIALALPIKNVPASRSWRSATEASCPAGGLSRFAGSPVTEQERIDGP